MGEGSAFATNGIRECTTTGSHRPIPSRVKLLRVSRVTGAAVGYRRDSGVDRVSSVV
jgi:hypothetical protein